MHKRMKLIKIGKRKGLCIEIGKFGMWFGFWFLAVDIIGGYHLEIG